MSRRRRTTPRQQFQGLEQFQPDRESPSRCVIAAPAETHAPWVPACAGMTGRTRSSHDENALGDAASPRGPAERRASLASARLLGRSFPRAVAVVLLAGTSLAGTWNPAGAKTATHHAARPTHHPSASAEHLAGASHLPVRMLGFQHLTSARISFELGDNAPPTVGDLPDGVELTFSPGTHVEIPSGLKLRQIAAIDAHEADGGTVAVVHLACDCTVTTETAPLVLRLDVRENPRTADRRPPASPHNGDLDKLRNDLTAKLAVLNAPPPPPNPATAPAAPAPVAPAAASSSDAAPPVPAAAPQICLPVVDMTHWRSNASFVSQLVGLRAQVARSHAGARDMAALAEFYLAYALGAEALAVASDALGGDATPDDHTRLVRDADIAHLLKGEQLDPTSPLLSSPPGCERADAGLWRALAAAAARDSDGVAQGRRSCARCSAKRAGAVAAASGIPHRRCGQRQQGCPSGYGRRRAKYGCRHSPGRGGSVPAAGADRGGGQGRGRLRDVPGACRAV